MFRKLAINPLKTYNVSQNVSLQNHAPHDYIKMWSDPDKFDQHAIRHDAISSNENRVRDI
jgi:hypothetical protein